MKSFYGQYGRNKFPIYSRIRTDDNSIGGKLLDEIGDALQTSLTDLKMNYKQRKALENLPVFERGKIFKVELFSNPEYINFLNSVNEKSFSIEVLTLDNLILSPKEYQFNTQLIASDFDLNKKRTEISDYILFDTLRSFFRFSEKKHLGEQGEHLWFYIPKTYKNEYQIDEIIKFKNAETTYRFNSNQKEGDYFIVIRGIDIADNYKEEQIRITNDTLYRTKTKFKYICDLVKDVERGIVGGSMFERINFEGRVVCSIFPIYRDYISYDFYELVSPYSKRIAGAEINAENEVMNFYSKMYLKLNRDEENDLDYLGYYFCGLDETTVSFTSQINDENKLMILMFEQRLDYDKEEGEKLNQIWPDYKINKLVAVSNLGNLYYFNVGKNEFNAPVLPKTKSITLELESMSQHVKFNSEIDLKIFNRNYGYEIDNVMILRSKPSERNNLVSNFEFLQADGTWSFNPFVFERDARKLFITKLEELRESSFLSSIQIPVLFNEVGQWDFYILSFANDNYHFKEEMNKYIRNPNELSASWNLYDFLISEINRNEYLSLQKDNPVNLNFELNYYSVMVENSTSSQKHSLEQKFLTELNVNNLQNINVNFYIDFVENNYIFYTIANEVATNIEAIPIENYYNFYNLRDRYLILYKDIPEVKINFTSLNFESGELIYSIQKTLNFTSLDEAAYKFNIFREKSERLNDFHTRVYKASQFTQAKERDYFQKCLGFITSKQDKNLFEINPKNENDFLRLKFSCAKLYVYKSIWENETETETLLFKKEINEIKFAIDFYNYILTLEYNNELLFDIKVLQSDNSWWYLKTRNFLQIDTQNTRNNFLLTNAVNYIPEKKIKRLMTRDGVVYRENSNLLDNPELEEEYLYENDIVFKSNIAKQTCKYEYSMFPVTIKWLPFRWAAFNDADFDYLVKDKCYYENTEELVPKILNQDGALLYNMVLKKHNHYWGS